MERGISRCATLARTGTSGPPSRLGKRPSALPAQIAQSAQWRGGKLGCGRPGSVLPFVVLHSASRGPASLVAAAADTAVGSSPSSSSATIASQAVKR